MEVQSQFIEMFGDKQWKEVHLEDVVSEDCSLSYGIVQPGEGVNEGIPVVRPVDLITNIVEPDNLKRTTTEIANAYKRTTLRGGELLLCVRGTTGVLAMASNNLNGGNVTRGIVPIWFRQNVSKSFMFYLMKSDYVQKQIKDKTYGTTLLQINIKDLRQIKVILPPDALQQEFIAIAEQADKSKFVGFKSQFIEMFGDPSTNKNGKKGKELFSFASGKANTKANLNSSFQYNCYGGNGITGKSNDYLLKDKTIVIGRVGEYCGCVHQTTDYCWITDNAIYLKTYDDSYRFQFIYYMFTMMNFHRFASETGQPKITQAPLLFSVYPVPSLDDQDKFISIAEQADKSKYYYQIA